MYGCVVDFLHLDVWSGVLPEAFPLKGGDYIALFPIGNIADVAIIAGVVLILVTQGAFHEAAQARDAAARGGVEPAAVRPEGTVS